MWDVIAAQAIQECRRRFFWPYVRRRVIDISGRQLHAASSQIETWAAPGNLRLRSPRVRVQDGIDRKRTFLRASGSGERQTTIGPYGQELTCEFANYCRYEPREPRPIAEVPIDVVNQVIKALC